MDQLDLSHAFTERLATTYDLVDVAAGLEHALTAAASLDDPRVREAIAAAISVTRLIAASLTCSEVETGT